jgi:hypothetical protein
MSNRTDIWSFGGGTQSIAIAVLIEQGRLPKPAHVIFADTGREASETMEYFEANVKPIFDRCGLTLEVASHDLATVDLYSNKGQLLMPVFTEGGALDTFCSNEWKKRVISRHLRSIGYGPKTPVRSWIGISRDEIGRAKQNDVAWNENYYPLLFGISPAFSRSDCVNLIKAYGMPDPPKSSCWMCPYRRNAQWRRLRDHYPADFAKAIALDEEVRAKDRSNSVYLHDSRVPLKDADLSEKPQKEGYLFGEVEHCDSGYCWT